MIKQNRSLFKGKRELFQSPVHGPPTRWLDAGQLRKVLFGYEEVTLNTSPTTVRHQRGNRWSNQFNRNRSRKKLFESGWRVRIGCTSPTNDDLDSQIQCMVDKEAELVAPHIVGSEFMHVIHQEGHSICKSIAPTRSKDIRIAQICGRNLQDMTVLTPKEGLTCGLKQMGATRLRFGCDVEEVDPLAGSINRYFAPLCGFKILFANKPLFEGSMR